MQISVDARFGYIAHEKIALKSTNNLPSFYFGSSILEIFVVALVKKKARHLHFRFSNLFYS